MNKLFVTTCAFMFSASIAMSYPYAGKTFSAPNWGNNMNYSFSDDCTEVSVGANRAQKNGPFPLTTKGRSWVLTLTNVRVTFRPSGASASVRVRGQSWDQRMTEVK